MILRVQHETCLEYSEPISEWLTEVRMEPVSDDDQRCHSFRLTVSQPSSLFRYQDGFGNRVHHFNLLLPHQQVRILASSVVATGFKHVDISQSRCHYPVELTPMPADNFTYLGLRGPVRRSSLLESVLQEMAPAAGERLLGWVERVRGFINSQFEYARYFTHVSSTIDDLLQHRKGVCQDFAHLMIAILRSHQVPARYVSGYIHRPNQESQSHAWCEVWTPDLGWVGMDPTNNRAVDEHFVRVAVGRDFTDVTPNKGTYRGNGTESMSVRVETEELLRLPALSWEDDLPPLEIPLASIGKRPKRQQPEDEQIQQQQQ